MSFLMSIEKYQKKEKRDYLHLNSFRNVNVKLIKSRK